jgi:hypothetical protein
VGGSSGIAFISQASLNVDIELVAMCLPPPVLPPLTIRTMPGTADMSGVRGIGGDAIVVGESNPVVVGAIVEAFEWTCSSKCRHPRSGAVSISSAVTLSFDSGCPELRPGEGAFQGKCGDREASAIGDTDLRFNGTFRLVAAADPSDS